MTINSTRLRDVANRSVDCLGPTPEKVAITLRDSKITGCRQSMNNCPVARYVADQIAYHIPSARVRVGVSSDTLLITQTPSDGDEYGDLLVSMDLPAPVTAFIQRFDSAFPDLIDNSAT